MGGLSSLWKEAKRFGRRVRKQADRTVNQIAKEVSRTVKNVGKFMGKIGVAGTVAMMMIMPGVGDKMSEKLKQVTTKMLGSDSVVVKGLASFLDYTNGVATDIRNTIGNISNAVFDTAKNFTATLGKKLGMGNEEAADTFFGAGDSAYSRSFGEGNKWQNIVDSEGEDRVIRALEESAIETDTLVVKPTVQLPNIATRDEIQFRGLTGEDGKITFDTDRLDLGFDLDNELTIPEIQFAEDGSILNIENVVQPASTLSNQQQQQLKNSLDYAIAEAGGATKEELKDLSLNQSLELTNSLGIDLSLPFETPEEEKPSLLSRAYEGTKDLAVASAKKLGSAVKKGVVDAPATIATFAIDGLAQEKAAEIVYGTEEEQLAELQAQYDIMNSSAAQASARNAPMLQFGTATAPLSYGGSGLEYTTPYQSSPVSSSPWGYNAYQSNVYGQRMSQFATSPTISY